MHPRPLSEEQRKLVDHNEGHLFAEACPGAGKTRAIVARYMRRTEEEPRKGIALVSFTNAAIDEVRGRCGDRQDALKAPHFVGTFDGFINRFISRPLYVYFYNKTPRFIESWKHTKKGNFRLPDMDHLPSFQLDWFEFAYTPDDQLCAVLRDDWVPLLPSRQLRSYVTVNRSRIEDQAVATCRRLVAKDGILSCAASRVMATGLLQRPVFEQRFGRLLADRFSEVIVDEAQDCGPEELFILRLVKRHGVTVATVADLDQSIFAFRRADPKGVLAFTKELGTPLALNGNYRSSPAICALNNSLRSGDRKETAAGDNASCELPVLLLEYWNQVEVAPAVSILLALHGRPRSEAVVLAHSESIARACAGDRNDLDSRSTHAILGVAWAHSILTSGTSTSTDRHRAIRLVEKTLRNIANVDDEDEAALDGLWLRDTAYRMVANLDPAGSAAKAYAQKVRDHVKQIRWPSGITPKDNLGVFLKAPPDSAWPTVGEGTLTPFLSGTIHSVKGREFPTAVVILPKNLREDAADQHVLDYWGEDIDSEARRVLYVGASRAQTLLILAVHADHANRVAELLKRDEVPYELAVGRGAKGTGSMKEK